MTKKQTPATVADVTETAFLTPEALAAQAGFTNWATITMYGATKLRLVTCHGDTDVLEEYSDRTERVLASYEAVYTTDLNVPTHPKITVIAGASHE